MMHNQDNSSKALSKEGFFNAYRKASLEKPTHVINDIVMQGMGYKIIDLKKLNDAVHCKNPNNYQKLLQLRHSFVEYLKDKFISTEKILILSLVKKANMFENRFDRMNDDVLNLIFKHLHPLNLNEKRSAISNIDETIRNHFKYELGLGCVTAIFDREYKLLNQPKFASLVREYLSRKLRTDELKTSDYDLNSLAHSAEQDGKSNLVHYRRLMRKFYKKNQTV